MKNLIICSILTTCVITGTSSCKLMRIVGLSHKKNTASDSTRRLGFRDTTAKDSAIVKQVPDADASRKALIESLMPLISKKTTYNTFSGKAKCHFEGKGEKQDFVANIRMEKGKVIWISVNALGGIVQVARVIITPDSIKFLNYLENTVTYLSAEQSANLLPVKVDFSTLQNVLIGDALSDKGTAIDAKDLGVTRTLLTEDDQYQQQLNFNKPDNTLHTDQVKARTGDDLAILIMLGNYVLHEGRNFSEDRTINIVRGTDNFLLEMNYNNVEFDKPLEFPFSVPKRFTVKQ